MRRAPHAARLKTCVSLGQVLQKAVCPEKRIGLDTAVSALASVTEVAVSGDLQVAKVYVSIFSDEQGKAVAMAGLTKLEGCAGARGMWGFTLTFLDLASVHSLAGVYVRYVRKHIGSRMRLRLTPEIRFINDDSIQREERVWAIASMRVAMRVLELLCALQHVLLCSSACALQGQDW